MHIHGFMRLGAYLYRLIFRASKKALKKAHNPKKRKTAPYLLYHYLFYVSYCF